MEAVGALPCARQTGEGRAGTVAVCTVGRDLTAQAPPPATPWAAARLALSSHFFARWVDARAPHKIGPRERLMY